MGPPELTEAERWKAIGMRNAGMSLREIAGDWVVTTQAYFVCCGNIKLLVMLKIDHGLEDLDAKLLERIDNCLDL